MLKKSILLFACSLAACVSGPTAEATREGRAESALEVQTELLSLDATGLSARFTIANTGTTPLCLGTRTSDDRPSIYFVRDNIRRWGDGGNFAIVSDRNEVLESGKREFATNGEFLVGPKNRVSFVFSQSWSDPKPELTSGFIGVPGRDLRPFHPNDTLVLVLTVQPFDCPTEDEKSPNTLYAYESANSETFKLP